MAAAGLIRVSLAFALLGLPAAASAQEPTTPPDAATAQIAPSPVLTVDQERLFAGSLYGRRVLAEIEDASRVLATENREIEARLEAEELDLTQRRPTLPPTEFRTLADAFDARVSEIRRTQDEKLRLLTQRREDERQTFYQTALPVLGELITEAGAVVILDNKAVFLAARRIDITDAAIARLDRSLGDGTARPKPEEN